MKAEWDESLSVGVAEIDDQHKRIFENFNAFSKACSNGNGAEKLNELFWFLGSYVATHFASEERLMQMIGFADYPKHHELHTTFISYVDALMARFSKEGPSEDLIATVNALMKDWLVEHISVMDRSIGQFVRRRNAM